MPTVLMRCGGNMLEMSLDGLPLPKELQGLFERALTYTHLQQLRGQEAFDFSGNYQAIKSEIRTMWALDGKGRFVASRGWKYRLEEMAKAAGYEVEIRDMDPPHPRPDRYVVDWNRLFQSMDLRPKQDELLAALEGYSFGLIDCPPGIGKTFIVAAYCLSHPKARVHVVTEGVDILRRIHRHLVKYIPNVGMVGGGKNRFGDRVTVISSDSLHKVGEGFDDTNSKRAADTVFFDEVHKAASPSVLPLIARYSHARMYGLSASIEGRFDKAHAQLEGVFGRVIFKLSYQEAVALGLCVPIRVEWIKVEASRSPGEGKVGIWHEKLAIWRNDFRNRAIAAKVNSFPKDAQILVMVAKTEHAVYLHHHLPDFQMCYDQMQDYDKYVEEGLLDPKKDPLMSPQRRVEMLDEFEKGTLRRVIATDVWSTGVDFENLQIVVRADARASAIMDIQIPGRANRIAEGKECGILVDVMDDFDSILLGRSNSRKKNYASRGWTQVGLSPRRPSTG